jgi:hypothetical protein
LDIPGLVNSISNAAIQIDGGRKGFATRGKEQEGRISYEYGIERAMSAFKEAQKSADPLALILAEYTFITQEFQLCDKADKDSLDSLTIAISNFDDAFLALQIVENKTLYQGAEKTYLHGKKHRVKDGYPKDAYHNACLSHQTRIRNTLRAIGIDPIEKALLKQRHANLKTAQNAYVEKQKKVLN